MVFVFFQIPLSKFQYLAENKTKHNFQTANHNTGFKFVKMICLNS